MTRVAIVGAGPAGAQCAYLLAKAGYDADIFEEHKTIGCPVQCTGIVTPSFEKILPVKSEFFMNKLSKVRAFAPNGSRADINVNDLVYDRAKLDQYLINRAVDAGATIHVAHRVTRIEHHHKETDSTSTIAVRHHNETTDHTYDLLIGADGPTSTVAKSIGVLKQRFWFGVQALVEMPVERDVYNVYFGDNFPNFFGWAVPESGNHIRIGLAAEQDSRHYFDLFMKKFGAGTIVEMQGGLIPLYNPNIKIQEKNTYLVGDAATHVKATTGGGIIPGMLAAQALAASIIENKSYKCLLKPIDRELRMGLFIRNALNKFTDQDYNYIVSLLAEPKLQRLLAEHDRDNPSKIIFKALFAEPRLALLWRTIFRTKRL
ncbi:NAD(P)/FAD-dependent oxidoreductase [Candidatus Woesearchaeota archaeon]|nr:NAD(P)/FAD-dependent oxidoreductase [Candidatus Woesearchaeota archaeon]